MSLTDMDVYYSKCISALHSNKEPVTLQANLEEAIKNKTGNIKDFSNFITTTGIPPSEEVRTVPHPVEETKTTSSSDNELELDLFNEDLMCIICNGMDVGARNRLLECSDCHSLYHQECHQPPVTSVDANATWTCQNCKDASKKLKASESPPTEKVAESPTSPPINNKPIIKLSPPGLQYQIASPLFKLIGAKSFSSTSIAQNAVPVTKISSKSSSTSTSSSTNKSTASTNNTNVNVNKTAAVAPNINIISADKRLQIMKKKAAKLHEKRKQLPRS